MTALKIASAADEPDESTPSCELVAVTPALAEKWLAKNVKNRPLKLAKVAQFTRDMVAENWQVTGEAIKFDVLGNLLDGQNRLTAVVASGADVPMYVVRGLATESQAVMDTGAPRSSSDALGLLGLATSKDLSPVCSALMGWEAGFFKHAMWQSNAKFTNTEIVEYAQAHPHLEEIVRFIKPVQKELPLPVGALGACAAAFANIDPDAMTSFYDRIHHLHTQGKGDPVSTLIRRVSETRQVKRRLWISTSIYFQVRAWNAFRAKEKLEKFQIGSDKAGWAKIPEPK